MAKKSSAQIRRLQQRAAARGETYTPPHDDNDNDVDATEEQPNDVDKEKSKEESSTITPEKSETVEEPQDEERTKLLTASAEKLEKELQKLDKDETLKSKERRSGKRKAEAIVAEIVGMSADELREWYKAYLLKNPPKLSKKKEPKEKGPANKKHTPYVVFVGQLSFDTTKDQLFQHIKSELGKEFKITQNTVKIRMLSDKKTKKSRGMAFVEMEDPESLYGLLKLHQTFLDGRRMNIERSAGGSKNSETRKAKISQYRQEQETYLGEVIDKMLAEYRGNGELQQGELDEGVILLCKRHSATIVQAALIEYIEKSGRDMDNPSAYLSYLITRFSEEGIGEVGGSHHNAKENRGNNDGKKQWGDGKKRKESSDNNKSSTTKKFKTSSEFGKAGIDMSASVGKATDGVGKIFPSARRGRGRGYM